MSQFITQMGDDLAGVDITKLTDADRQFLFEALADFFTKNADPFGKMTGEQHGTKVQITVNIQANPG